jgi:hypothetical protein
MTPTTASAEKASPIRRNYVPLGTDQEDARHVYRTVDETRGWADKRYGFDLVDQLADALEVA